VPQLVSWIRAHPTPIVPVTPPVDARHYERVARLVPPSVKIDVNDPRYLAIVAAAGPGRESIIASADDAFILSPHCMRRMVYVYNVSEYGGRAALEKWVLDNYAPLPEIAYLEV
jgi:hypothetical protein